MGRSRASTVEREIGRELAVLRTQLGQLTELVEEYGEKKGTEVAASLSGKAKEFLDHARNTSDYLADYVSDLVNGRGEMVKHARDVASREVERVEHAVADRPLAALLCAVGAGIALGWLLSRR
jgi:ElaB/YqjD/DUF883 family membrane-anchored ribosome-binding protein